MPIFFLVKEIIYSTKENVKKKSAYDKKKNEDIQEIFKVKKSRRWDQKSRRYPGDFQEMATLYNTKMSVSLRYSDTYFMHTIRGVFDRR